jgi:hypothetical protein
MRLIGLVVALTLSFVLAPLAAEAQPAGKVWRIGWLGISGSTPPEALVAGLRERGYVEGQNIVIERRYSEGREERFPGYVAELVQMKVDLILVVNTQGALAAKAATSSIPIVLAGVLDPDRTGLVASLGRPGGNVTGISNQLLEVQSKHFQLIKEALPHLTRAWQSCGIRRTQHQPWRGKGPKARRGPWYHDDLRADRQPRRTGTNPGRRRHSASEWSLRSPHHGSVPHADQPEPKRPDPLGPHLSRRRGDAA